MANLIFTDHAQTWKNGGDFPQIPLTQVSWDSDPQTPVAFVFFGHVNIDFDGSPTAYGPAGIDPLPDDYLSNAGNEQQGYFGVFALAPDDPLVTAGTAVIDTNAPQYKGKYPVVQQAANGDPCPGYYVSTTPHPTGPGYLQSSYVDASQIAFGALSGKLASLGCQLGDYALAVRHDQNLQSGFYFLDRGANTYALGECSHKVGKNLGGSGRGNHFNNNFPVSFIVFPGSSTSDPSAVPSISDDDIKSALEPLLEKLGEADNAADLALLMGFNESNPPARPQGTSKLSAYHDQGGSAQPRNAQNILQSLQSFGFAPSLTLADAGNDAGTGETSDQDSPANTTDTADSENTLLSTPS